ncbi:hypothetical protein EVAR_67688_1 [Eumeta japonica]|uniref:Uncharacterized protein n=1 Tax=Eumeta variegata TaxID=151549 RepID=A0A4C1ZP74_EUMVA|nr:hypothetical protein EVAR_67688_1 [Eumeta japonica]
MTGRHHFHICTSGRHYVYDRVRIPPDYKHGVTHSTLRASETVVSTQRADAGPPRVVRGLRASVTPNKN